MQWNLLTFSAFWFSYIIHNSCRKRFYTAVFVICLLIIFWCLYFVSSELSVKYLVSIISIFAALNHTCLVNISILFTFMFLKIRILFHNIPVSFTFMFHDIRIQIFFTRWIYGWRQGYGQSIYLDTLSFLWNYLLS